MRMLLDSHALVWFLTGDARCSQRAREAISADEATVFVSAASAWEIATKVRAGKWPEASELAKDVAGTVRDATSRPFPLHWSTVLWRDLLPGEHRDPFDRMLTPRRPFLKIFVLVTADRAFRNFNVTTLW